MHDKPVALVTGTNQGIGLQIAKELAAKTFTVLVGSRNFARGEEAAKTIDGDARALQLSRRAPASPYASRCSARTARQARSQMQPDHSRGDVDPSPRSRFGSPDPA